MARSYTYMCMCHSVCTHVFASSQLAAVINPYFLKSIISATYICMHVDCRIFYNYSYVFLGILWSNNGNGVDNGVVGLQPPASWQSEVITTDYIFSTL